MYIELWTEPSSAAEMVLSVSRLPNFVGSPIDNGIKGLDLLMLSKSSWSTMSRMGLDTRMDEREAATCDQSELHRRRGSAAALSVRRHASPPPPQPLRRTRRICAPAGCCCSPVSELLAVRLHHRPAGRHAGRGGCLSRWLERPRDPAAVRRPRRSILRDAMAANFEPDSFSAAFMNSLRPQSGEDCCRQDGPLCGPRFSHPR